MQAAAYPQYSAAYRDQFGGQFQPQLHYSCPPPPTYVHWPLKDQQQSNSEDTFQLPQQQQQSTVKSDSSAASTNMELAHLNVLQHHDIKPDPLHMSLLGLPTSQASQPQLPPPLINQLSSQSSMDSNITLWQFLLEMLTSKWLHSKNASNCSNFRQRSSRTHSVDKQ